MTHRPKVSFICNVLNIFLSFPLSRLFIFLFSNSILHWCIGGLCNVFQHISQHLIISMQMMSPIELNGITNLSLVDIFLLMLFDLEGGILRLKGLQKGLDYASSAPTSTCMYRWLTTPRCIRLLLLPQCRRLSLSNSTTAQGPLL